jgi:hypothetical protein
LPKIAHQEECFIFIIFSYDAPFGRESGFHKFFGDPCLILKIGTTSSYPRDMSQRGTFFIFAPFSYDVPFGKQNGLGWVAGCWLFYIYKQTYVDKYLWCQCGLGLVMDITHQVA